MGNMQGGSCSASCGMSMSNTNPSTQTNVADGKQMEKMAPAAGGSCGCGMSQCTGHNVPSNTQEKNNSSQGHVMKPGMKM
jgi:hypothetical protein